MEIVFVRISCRYTKDRVGVELGFFLFAKEIKCRG